MKVYTIWHHSLTDTSKSQYSLVPGVNPPKYKNGKVRKICNMHVVTYEARTPDAAVKKYKEYMHEHHKLEK